MIIRIIKSQIKYFVNELKVTSKANIIFFAIFMLFYMYCIRIGKPINEYNSGELYLTINMVSAYILVRIVISGFNLPNNAYRIGENNYNYMNGSVMDADLPSIYAVQVILKGLFSGIVNAVTICIIMSALNLIVDWRNYILIILFILFGTFHVMMYGFITCAIIKWYGLKKEIVAIFEVVFIWLCFYMKEDSYVFPITIYKTQLEGIFMNDLLYSKFMLSEILGYAPLWAALVFLFFLTIKLSNEIISVSIIEGKNG